ncbi:FAS apoptotic inhibitory [Blastocystis sp. subtype 4]|uniref:FAS apoptotic inhibitory n=1 Tax=Blastocystis sp. subtype 4 TaxID=944170 RepID=UPI0007117453|nr:FAS apoptotic inhibitory [Blastocystis sp. subtype 4]KNB45074.1 FAS apoptotic inhibitory [Blastocystis sp. subtype 4]|eukprot:XP_014528517.1 FAS apoptotic inhibitory [Blastocystis sp. subtype 4]
MIAFMVVSLCKPQLFVRYPHNIVILALFTLCEALLLSSFTAFFEPRIVLTAIVYTAAVVFCLSIYAAKTSKDFISYQPVVLSFCLILLLFGFTLIWIPFGTAIYSAIGACIFSFYLIMDTQMILGGKDRAQFGVDEYVYATIMLLK